MQQAMATQSRLISKAKEARSKYHVARAARRDSGANVENNREAKARRAYEAAVDKLRDYEAANTLAPAYF